MGMNDKHDYEPTKWVDNSEPDIDAEHLNKIELALQEYGASIDELAATGGTAAKVKATDTYGLVVDALGESTAQALIDAIANKVVNELINKNKIVNNLLATDASTVLAGTQGAALDKRLVAAENAVTQLNSEALFTNALHTVSANDSNGIKNDMYANWNTFKTGVAALLYRNSAEAWIGLINKYDNAKGSVLLINSWGSIKVYRHYGTVLTDIYVAS